MKSGTLVMVEWEDSRRPVGEWTWWSELVIEGPVQCVSVGWLVEQGEVLVLAPNAGDVGSPDPQVGGVIRIPWRAVTRMTRLKAKHHGRIVTTQTD